MGKKHPAHALTSQQAAPNQDARKLAIFTAAFVLLVLLAFSLTLRAKKFGKKQPAHATTA
jgi:heme/copper-type cytochrome/quinol oxidase subunit 2